MRSLLPPVCICIPTYNAETTIRETLESILSQTYLNLVVHVVDNASTDDTLKIVESMADSRVRILRHEHNIGGIENMSYCMTMGEGKYTAIFHADDVYEPDIVAKQVAFLESHPKAGAVFTEATLIDVHGIRIGKIGLPRDLTSANGLYDFATMFKAILRHSNFFICPTFMVRTQIYKHEIKGCRSDLFGAAADLDVWLRILQHHSIGHIPEQLIRYRVGVQQFSAQVRRETGKSVFFKIVDYYLEQNQARSLVDATDLRYYKWLERRDRVMRALNLVLKDCPQEAGRLLNDMFTWDAFNAALVSKRGLLVLLLGTYIKFLLAVGANKLGKSSLANIMRITNK